ncbi:hypothetical protein EZJ49_14350 [Bdellovibrio bacteriovorus]|uniref:hypothetical protein n=1 Tax=Bdellovibrio bacteriovorus TaxID=959 RepID=UPI0021CF76C7|nr:hypothetical protein [Bdellovibrio bacteriovorus]UXR64245.1 hypothetical protein EZJ49_14350 [Bdellovibrio bacteriovorus]
MKKSLNILLSSALALTACAPKVEERLFEQPKTSFGPQSKDAQLNLRLREFGQAVPALTWRDTVSSATYFEQAEALIELGEKTGLEKLKNTGLAWIRNFYKTPESTLSIELAKSPFAALATGQTQEQVRTTLSEVLVELDASRPTIRSHILNLGGGLPQTPVTGLGAMLTRAEMFSNMVLAEVPRMGLTPTIEDGLKVGLVDTTKPLFADAREFLQRLMATKTLTQALALIDEAVKKFEIELDPELQKSMKQGRQLARGLDGINGPQTALAVLVDIWRVLTAEERAQYFKPVNEDLYDFLKKQDEKELSCLQADGCLGGVINGIAKKIFILPKIKNYGIEKLRTEMNEATRGYVISSIEAFASEFVKTMPQTFADNIDTAIVDKAAAIARVRDGYGNYVSNLFTVWQQKILPESQGQLPGFETNRVTVNIASGKDFSLQAVPASLNVSGEALGAGLSASAQLLLKDSSLGSMAFSHMLAQVNKLVAVGGYRDIDNNLIPALLAPVNHRGKLLDIMNFDDSKDQDLSFRIPDSIALQDPYHADPAMTYEKDFSAASFAAQVRGLSRMMRITRDWEKTVMDEQLGHIQAQDLTTDAEHDDLKQPLFPKDMLFALNLGDAAVLLQDLTKKATPVFLLTTENNLLWADSYGNTPETAIMAGIVDIKKGERLNFVKTKDIAQFLLAMTEFLDATENVEKTKSSILLAKDANGEAPLDVLLTGRKDMKLLVLAVANFISNQLVQDNKLVITQMSLTDRKAVAKKPFLIVQQAYAMQALIKAYQLTNIDSYLWSAQEIYYAMNRTLFNPKEEFYINSDGSKLSFPERVQTLLALQHLKPYLPTESRPQLERLMAPWLEALKNLK